MIEVIDIISIQPENQIIGHFICRFINALHVEYNDYMADGRISIDTRSRHASNAHYFLIYDDVICVTALGTSPKEVKTPASKKKEVGKSRHFSKRGENPWLF